MKDIGVVRKTDGQGRIVLPIELRERLGIKIKDSIEIYVDEQYILLKKYNPACSFCNGFADLKSFRGKFICKKCLSEL